MTRYDLRATYRGQRVRVIQALEGAQWAIELDGVPVSVSSQSLSDFRSERVTRPGGTGRHGRWGGQDRPQTDAARVLVVVGELGRVRAVLDLYDAGRRDCRATLGDLRAAHDRRETPPAPAARLVQMHQSVPGRGRHRSRRPP